MNGIDDLRKLDCNCNDCIYLCRDNLKRHKHRESYRGTGRTDNLQFGHCQKFNKKVVFSPNTCQLETQECFRYRNEYSLTAINVCTT